MINYQYKAVSKLLMFICSQHIMYDYELYVNAVYLLNDGSAYRALSLSFSDLYGAPTAFFQCMAAPKSYSYLHYITYVSHCIGYCVILQLISRVCLSHIPSNLLVYC